MRRVSSWGTRAEELDTKSCNLIWHEIVYTEFFLKSEGRRISSRCAKSINRRVVHGNELWQTEKYLHKQIIKHAELVPQHPEVSVWYVNKHSRFKGPTIITELRSEPRMRSTVVGCSDRKVHGSLSLVAFSLMTLMKTLFRLKIESDEFERRLKQVSFYSFEVQFHSLNSSEHWLFFHHSACNEIKDRLIQMAALKMQHLSHISIEIAKEPTVARPKRETII